jgi:ASC-1-like (ASCH) protein
MDHVAIMKKSWGLLPKVLSGEKKIESRWYLNKSVPWGKIAAGDKVYFKNSGEPVTVSSEVEKVRSYGDLTPDKVRELLMEYGLDDGIKPSELDSYYNLFKDKRYCLLVFLKDPQKTTPFNINKKGFGAMASWICIDDVEKVKV